MYHGLNSPPRCLTSLLDWEAKKADELPPPASKAASFSGSGTNLMTSFKISKLPLQCSYPDALLAEVLWACPLRVGDPFTECCLMQTGDSGTHPLAPFKTSKLPLQCSYPDALLAEVLWACPLRVGDPFTECCLMQTGDSGTHPLAPFKTSKLPLQCSYSDALLRNLNH